MRLAIRYVTRFLYTGAVWDSHNVLRACPISDDRQRLVEYRVLTDPVARVYAYADYWGTRVDAFGVRAPHPRLEIVAEAIVETRPASVPPWAQTLTSEAASQGTASTDVAPQGVAPSDARSQGVAASEPAQPAATTSAAPSRTAAAAPEFVSEYIEYLQPSPHASWEGELRAQAEEWIADAGDDAAAAVAALYRAIGATMRYTSGATKIGIDVNAVLRQRAGVCQDFAHLLIALCRSVGIPARYVSGYLLPDERDVEPHELIVEVKTHAWVEVALPGSAWLPLDPTNGRPVGARHVKIGHGRDYDDVLPLRGVYHGAAEHQLDVSVRMRQLGSGQQ